MVIMKDDWFEKIEEYLNGRMSSEEKSLFEAELSSNEELITLFKVYRTIETEMRNNEKFSADEKALKKTLNTLNLRYFEGSAEPTSIDPDKTDTSGTVIHPTFDRSPEAIKKIQFNNKKFNAIVYSIAASIVMIFVAYFAFFSPKKEPQRLAENYIKGHLMHLSQTMSPSATDTFQQAITAYNNKEYSRALTLFQEVYNKEPENIDAKKNIGLVYLVTKDYAKALQYFDELSGMKNAHSNPGMFLKAVTLMQRNTGDDRQEAKRLLQKVLNTKAEGHKQAGEWLKKL